MSDLSQGQHENLNAIADSPPTQPQSWPEAPTLQRVRFEADFLSLVVGEQGVRELCAHFGAESVDDLAESDWREFIRLATMSCGERPQVLGSKRTAPPAITAELNGNATITMRDKAVAQAKMGFRVFPVKQGTKAPALPPNKPRPPKRQYHRHIPSSDPVDVAAMWTGPRGESLTFDIGFNTDGLLVLDIDDRDGRTGTASFADLARMHELDLNTVVASTPSGGRHYYYKLPQGIDPSMVKSGSDKLGSGIDHRSYNSLVVAPGTVRPGKGEYRWLRSPEDTEIKVAPLSLVELCQQTRQREAHDPPVMPGFEVDRPDAINRFRDHAARAPEAIQNAGGRVVTIALLRLAGDFGLMAATAVEVLCEPDGWNETKAIPPWDEGELLELAESLEPSRDRPIGCDSAYAYFDAVEIEVEPPTPEEKAKTRLFWRTYEESKRRATETAFDALIDDYLERGAMSVLYGESGAGKTFVALDFAYHVAARREWCRRKVNGGPAVYVAAEAGETINARIGALDAYYKPEKEPLLAVVPCQVNLFDPKADLRGLIDLVNRWAEHCGEKVALIVLDTLARIMGSGDENAARDMGILVQNIDTLRVATGAHVMVVHHSGKNKANGARGSSALRAATDTEIEVEKHRIRVRKQRASEEASDIRFRLKSVTVGKNANGKSVTSCIVETGAALDFEPLVTNEQQEWIEQLQAFAEMKGLKEFTHEDMKLAWAGGSAVSETAERGGSAVSIRAVQDRAAALVEIGSLELVSKKGTKPKVYKLSAVIGSGSAV
jgi:AAA domain/Bifunctional DNA primase/polymerase, N-terminal